MPDIFQFEPADDRIDHRRPVRIEGKLLSPDLAVSAHCVIRNVSQGGAFVTTRAVTLLPDRVYLWQAETGTAMECTVRWRKHDKLFGLQFTDAVDAKTRRTLTQKCAPQGMQHLGEHQVHRSPAITEWRKPQAAREQNSKKREAVVIDFFTREQRRNPVQPLMPVREWLQAIGLVVIGADGSWHRTELCDAELAKLQRRQPR